MNKERHRTQTRASNLLATHIPNSSEIIIMAAPPPSSDSSEASATRKRRLSWSGSRKINTYEQDQRDNATATTSATTSATESSINNNNNSQPTLPQHQNSFFSSLLAGVGSGSLASVVCAPLDLVRTRMQAVGGIDKRTSVAAVTNNSSHNSHNPRIVQSLHQIYVNDGVRGCFRGLGVTLATVPAFWGLYFPLYEKLKETLFQAAASSHDNHHHDEQSSSQQSSSDNDHNLNALIHLTSAIAAGAVADVVCNPMFVIRTRMQTEALHYFQVPLSQRKPHTILQTAALLYNEGKVPIFWRGLSASLLGLGHVGIQFPLYERFKAEARRRSESDVESPMDLLLASGASKMMATSVTYPHEVVRSRMMDARGNHRNRVLGVWGTLSNIVETEGYRGLYVGLRVSLVRVIPNCCVTFVSYELIARWVRGAMD